MGLSWPAFQGHSVIDRDKHRPGT